MCLVLLKSTMEQTAIIEYPVAEFIRDRRSTRAFSDKPIGQEQIQTLFEATRWAPSSTNEQPWKFFYALKGEPFWQEMLEVLNESNQVWAKEAPLLIASIVRKNFSRNNTVNAYAMYDLGAANAFLALQAVELGLQVRQMAGYQFDKARTVLNIPDEYELGVFIAVGYPGSSESLPPNLQAREQAPRVRKRQEEFVLRNPH